MTYNIQYGFGLDGQYDPERIAKSLKGADVIALQEVTRGAAVNNGADLPEIFAGFFPDYHWVYGPACDLYVSSEMIGGRRVDRRYQFGNMVLSRWPILSNRLLLLPRTRTFEKLNMQRGATEALIDTPGGPLRVYSVHLDHVAPDERIAQIRMLKTRALDFLREGGAITGGSEFHLPQPPLTEDFLLMGDFNMQPESPEYREMAGTADLYYGRTVRADVPTDALAHLSRITPDSHSWIEPAKPDRRMLLDYCFVSGSLVHRLKDGWIDYDATGSDHLPVWVEIV
ncbi:endonuclease/exonuclease/phosphatase family metal-dependent hydrolase [Rhizobium paknamense]|uniref:Endonuclease/exonuclease/phosphatase family metal-dependent hydrolase n=1 Tax=Rhizobium paknamense TaxID=1206817 RepID=A0ABU0II32_9HYPH|nr:endonuclease/exonuclease/phosphatase family metal-dependent hydrolase [Rhizobium paknamense]